MSGKTSIEWTATFNADGSVTPGATWNPIRYRVRKDAGEIARAKGYTSLVQIAEKMAAKDAVGQHCEHVSPGCVNCYSGTWQSRCLPVNGTGLPFDRRSRDLVEPFIDEKELLKPLGWRTPRKVFAINQSDLFGEWVPVEMIGRVFTVMALAERHTFQALTKRSKRMREYLTGDRSFATRLRVESATASNASVSAEWSKWPLPNVWLGVSVEDQPQADERILDLLATPAAIRFLSVEPMLGPIDLEYPDSINKAEMCCPGRMENECGCRGLPTNPPLLHEIDWVICGGESGRGARPMNPAWVRSLRDQCVRNRVPFFFKQFGQWSPCGVSCPMDSKCIRFDATGNDVTHDMSQWRDGGFCARNVGKKKSGRLLDGHEWSEFPKVRA